MQQNETQAIATLCYSSNSNQELKFIENPGPQQEIHVFQSISSLEDYLIKNKTFKVWKIQDIRENNNPQIIFKHRNAQNEIKTYASEQDLHQAIYDIPQPNNIALKAQRNKRGIERSDAIGNGRCIMKLLDTYYNNNQGEDLDEKQSHSLSDLLNPMISLIFLDSGTPAMTNKCWYLKQFSKALQSPYCKLLSLSFNYLAISDQGMQYLSEALRSLDCKLISLGFRFPSIGDQGMQYLSEALQSPNCKLMSLSFDSLSISDLGVQYLSEALQSPNCKLVALKFIGGCCGNKIDAKNIQYLSKALQSQYCQLTTLNLSVNNIGDQGIQYLSQALKSPYCKLIVLKIAKNGIQDQGMEYLSQALQSPDCKLANLNLDDNPISDQGVQYLSQALMSPNCQLSSISLRVNVKLFANPISNHIFEIFAQVLKSPCSKLTSVIISPSFFDKLDGIELLIEAIQNNHQLTTFNIVFCDAECLGLTCSLLVCLIGAFLMYYLQEASTNLTNLASKKIQPFIKRNKLLLTDCCKFLKTGQWEEAKKLLDSGVSANNAMLKMAKAGQLQAMQWLLQNSDAQINIFDVDIKKTVAISTYDTPLCLAAENGHLDVVKWLVMHGAKITVNNKNLSPLDLAVKNNHSAVVAFLKNFIFTPNQFSAEKYQAEKQTEILQTYDNVEEKYQSRVDNTLVFSTPFVNNLPTSYSYLQPEPISSTFFQASSLINDEQETIELDAKYNFSFY